MRASGEILAVWNQFYELPMETFTKGWWYAQCDGQPTQRTVEQMREHRVTWGTSGNCFDLAIWLQHEFDLAGIRAEFIGHHLFTPKAHAAVVAYDLEGYAYLCDLGDQWAGPILIDPRSPDFDRQFFSGFMVGAEVRVHPGDSQCRIEYRRPNGHVSEQTYDTTPVTSETMWAASEHSQRLLRKPQLELLRCHPQTGQAGIWEYEYGQSRWSLDTGLIVDEPCKTIKEWASRIECHTGIHSSIVIAAFESYGGL